MKAIEINGLTKQYKDVLAVDHLNLTIQQGELFSLLGVNGAGKTTTIKMLSCVLAPTSGDALLLGDSIIVDPSAVKAKINISPQETAVGPNLSVRENLEMIAGIYGYEKKAVRDKVEEMLTKFGLQPEARKKAKTLSGGMRRRLSIAMALISAPQILFLDEPTLGLDVLARRELWKVIEMLKEKTTMILTTHYMEEAEALSDRIGVLVKGQLKAVGTPEELMVKTQSSTLEDAFVALAAGNEVKFHENNRIC